MMPSKDFRSLIVEPAAEQFRAEPTSLLHAYTVIWAIDAYASHLAFEKAPPTAVADSKKRKNVETNFKNDLVRSSREGAWQFRIVREVSNAGKHALRSNTTLGVERSSALSTQAVDGSAWYFEGPTRAPYWGEQIIVELDLTFDHANNVWLDRDGTPFPGPLFNTVPVYGLITPSLALIEAGARPESTVGAHGHMSGQVRTT